MEVLADLPDDSWESWSEQLLHVVRPRAVPVVRLQVVDPLKQEKQRKRLTKIVVKLIINTYF